MLLYACISIRNRKILHITTLLCKIKLEVHARFHQRDSIAAIKRLCNSSFTYQNINVIQKLDYINKIICSEYNYYAKRIYNAVIFTFSLFLYLISSYIFHYFYLSIFKNPIQQHKHKIRLKNKSYTITFLLISSLIHLLNIKC